MTRMGLLLLVCLGAVAPLAAQPARNPLDYHGEEGTPEPLPSGPALMREVRGRLPTMPLRMSGFIRTREDGKDRDRLLVSELRFGDSVPSASYTLSDRFGAPLTVARVTWPRGRAVFEQWNADGGKLPAPEPSAEVADTGLTWSDLSLSFLWWSGAEVVERDRVKSRVAYVVRIPAPESREDVDTVRLWIDRKALFIVKAELLNAEGDLLKRIEVDSIKEIREGLWMVKDLKIRDEAGGRRMGIRFEEVEELEE